MKNLYQEIFKMKTLLRRGWLLRKCPDKTSGRYESDAEHTFSMTMLALAIIERDKLTLNTEKVLKMIIYHDLCEIDGGDWTIADDITPQRKYQLEIDCINRLASELKMPEIKSLWIEFEENKTAEAQFVRKIDKLDAIMQSQVYCSQRGDYAVFEEFYNNGKDKIGELDKFVN